MNLARVLTCQSQEVMDVANKQHRLGRLSAGACSFGDPMPRALSFFSAPPARARRTMPATSSPATGAINILCGAAHYSPGPSEEREALSMLLTQPDADARLLQLVGEPGTSVGGQRYALEGLQALGCAAAVHAIRRVAENDAALACSLDLYTVARNLPVGALLRLVGGGEQEVKMVTEEAGLRTAGELIRYVGGVDGGDGKLPAPDEMALRALSLEIENVVPLAALRAAAEEAIALLALTRRHVAPIPASESEVEHSREVGCGGDEPMW